MRVAHKVTDHHLHQEWQWQAAMTTHWVHQLPTVGVDKHIIIFPKTWANHYTQSASWVSEEGFLIVVDLELAMIARRWSQPTESSPTFGQTHSTSWGSCWNFQNFQIGYNEIRNKSRLHKSPTWFSDLGSLSSPSPETKCNTHHTSVCHAYSSTSTMWMLVLQQLM